METRSEPFVRDGWERGWRSPVWPRADLQCPFFFFFACWDPKCDPLQSWEKTLTTCHAAQSSGLMQCFQIQSKCEAKSKTLQSSIQVFIKSALNVSEMETSTWKFMPRSSTNHTALSAKRKVENKKQSKRLLCCVTQDYLLDGLDLFDPRSQQKVAQRSSSTRPHSTGRKRSTVTSGQPAVPAWNRLVLVIHNIYNQVARAGLLG